MKKYRLIFEVVAAFVFGLIGCILLDWATAKSSAISEEDALSSVNMQMPGFEGDTECWRLGDSYLASGDIQVARKAFVQFLAAAEQDDNVAKFDVALLYHNGFGVEKDLDQAIYWMSQVKASQSIHRFGERACERDISYFLGESRRRLSLWNAEKRDDDRRKRGNCARRLCVALSVAVMTFLRRRRRNKERV